MEILELYLKHFGKFEEHRVELFPGVNIIYGGNETGKSTIHAFIRAMFFGIERSRGKAGKKDEYQLRQPWDNPAYFAGTMRVKYKENIYRIERNFYKNEKDVHLICESSGQEMPAGQQELSQLLAGMSEAAFRNTIFIPQAGCETDAGLAEELQRFMVNFQETRDGNLDVAKALDRLKGQKKKLEGQKKQEQELLDEKIARKQMEADYVKRELEQLSGRNEKKEEQESLGYAGTAEEEEHISGVDQEETRNIREEEGNRPARHSENGIYRRFLLWLNILLFLCGGLGLACGFFAWELGKKILLYAVGALFYVLFGMTCKYSIKMRKELFPKKEKPKQDEAELNMEENDGEQNDREQGKKNSNLSKLWKKITAISPDVEENIHGQGESGADWNWEETQYQKDRRREKNLSQSLNHYQDEMTEKPLQKEERLWKQEARQKEFQEKSVRLQVIQGEMEDLYSQREKLAAYDRETEAIDLAILRIRELSERIYREAGSEFGRKASEILTQLTEGRYTRIALDEKMQVRINTPSRLLYLSQVSYGTMNQIYFALRIAAGELLTYGESLPILLDEAFAMYDDERLEAALRWLDRSGRQVILFTCQQREKVILDRIRRRI